MGTWYSVETTLHTDLSKHITRPVSFSVWLCLVKTDASFGKTEGLFCKTDICLEVSNMYMFCIRFSNRYLFWSNRGLIYFLNIIKKTMLTCSHQKKCTMPVSTKRASVFINRVSISSKQRLTLEKKTSVFIKQSLCLSQTRPLCMLEITTCILYAVLSQPWLDYIVVGKIPEFI